MIDAFQAKRMEAAQGLIDILDESLHSYSGSGRRARSFDQTFILGAFFSAICDSSTGITIIPRNSTPPVSPPFQLQWQPRMNEQSINLLLGNVLAITDKFSAHLQLHRQPISPNPVPPLAGKVVGLRENMRGLALTDFRSDVAILMNTKSCLGNVVEETEPELLRLRKHSVYVPPNDKQQPGKDSLPMGHKREELRVQSRKDNIPEPVCCNLPLILVFFVFFVLVIILMALAENQK